MNADVRAATRGQAAESLDFKEFFEAEYRGLVRALYVLTADQDEAEELAQDTMARVYERWDRVRAMESPGGYVYRIAVNLNRRRLRHLAVRARRLLALTEQVDAAPPPGARTEIGEALAALPVGQRQAFMLVEWLGLSAAEAGRILLIAPGSVRTRVHRARAALRAQLCDTGGTDG